MYAHNGCFPVYRFSPRRGEKRHTITENTVKRRLPTYQHTHTLNMRRLREEIDRLHADHAIAAGPQQLEIARQRRWLA